MQNENSGITADAGNSVGKSGHMLLCVHFHMRVIKKAHGDQSSKCGGKGPGWGKGEGWRVSLHWSHPSAAASIHGHRPCHVKKSPGLGAEAQLTICNTTQIWPGCSSIMPAAKGLCDYASQLWLLSLCWQRCAPTHAQLENDGKEWLQSDGLWEPGCKGKAVTRSGWHGAEPLPCRRNREVVEPMSSVATEPMGSCSQSLVPFSSPFIISGHINRYVNRLPIFLGHRISIQKNSLITTLPT